MQGKSAVIAIGQKIIQLVRHKLTLKYGSAVCVQQNVRKTTEWQDLERSYQARIHIHCYRQYNAQNLFLVPLTDRIKIFNEIQAGNCGQMSILTFEILCSIIPPGLKVQHRAILNPKDNQSHQYTTIRPAGTKDKSQTLVIDPWPSNQLISPEVVSLNDFFKGDKEDQVLDYFQNESQKSGIRNPTTFDNVEMNDFNAEKLQQMNELIDKKDILMNEKWKKYRFWIYQQPSIHSLIADKKGWELFKHRRLDIRSVRKEKPIML